MPSKSIYSSVFCVGADFETIMPTKTSHELWNTSWNQTRKQYTSLTSVCALGLLWHFSPPKRTQID